MEYLQEEMIVKGDCDDSLEQGICRVQAAIDFSLEQEAKKAAFLSKVRYIKEGERNSKYFFGLSKRNFVHKTMYKLRKANGELTKDYREILNEQRSFYEELYSSNASIKFNIQNTSGCSCLRKTVFI